MTTPRTIAGQAALSGMQPWIKRALGQTIVAIEDEAMLSHQAALRDVDLLLADIAALDSAAEWGSDALAEFVERAKAARRLVEPLITPAAELPRTVSADDHVLRRAGPRVTPTRVARVPRDRRRG